MGTIQIDGSTPKLTIGNATAEDATILFDGNAQDFYIALDDSADDLLIGLGSTVGTTPAIAIDENLKVNIPVTTASTSTSTGSLTTGGGMGVGADLYVGDDAYLITDSAVLGFGADKDTLLTHTDGTGLTLNSTNKLCFNDASQFVQGSSATVISIGATDEIDLTATAIDINGTCDISGTFSLGGTNMTATAAELNLLDGGTSVGSSITIADADGFVVNDGGTMKTIPATDIPTYVVAGIKEFDQWRKTDDTEYSGQGRHFITSSWERDDSAEFDKIGTGMSESSGVFTFPSTGKWLIGWCPRLTNRQSSTNRDLTYLTLEIAVTTNDSSYNIRAAASMHWAGATGGENYNSAYTTYLFDVTNVSTHKVKVACYSADSFQAKGDTNGQVTWTSFMRVGDT